MEFINFGLPNPKISHKNIPVTAQALGDISGKFDIKDTQMTTLAIGEEGGSKDIFIKRCT